MELNEVIVKIVQGEQLVDGWQVLHRADFSNEDGTNNAFWVIYDTKETEYLRERVIMNPNSPFFADPEDINYQIARHTQIIKDYVQILSKLTEINTIINYSLEEIKNFKES